MQRQVPIKIFDAAKLVYLFGEYIAILIINIC